MQHDSVKTVNSISQIKNQNQIKNTQVVLHFVHWKN